MHVTPTPLLRWSLAIDAVASTATGLLMALAATPLASLTALPQPYLLYAGAFVLGYGLLVGALSMRAALPRWLVLSVVVGNLGWALHCVLLAFAAGWAPTVAGMAFLLVQAVLVAGLAEAQWFGLRRSALQPPHNGTARHAIAR